MNLLNRSKTGQLITGMKKRRLLGKALHLAKWEEGRGVGLVKGIIHKATLCKKEKSVIHARKSKIEGAINSPETIREKPAVIGTVIERNQEVKRPEDTFSLFKRLYLFILIVILRREHARPN